MSWQRKEAVNQGGSFRTVSPGATTTVKVVAAGITYTATTTAWIKANTRYTIAFIADPVKPTVTIDNTNGPNWEHGETGTVPAGYDYYIYTKKDLEDWANDPTNLGKYAIQMANIEWDGTWTPIGGHTNLFTGVYNGNGHTITGLNIGTVDTYSGMFGRVSNNAVLTGIHLRGATININTAKHAGLLAGEAAGSTISLCSAQGKITHTDAREVGGLVGYTNNAHVTRCYADAIINTTTENLGRGRTGGLVGDSNNTYIIACGANTALSATYYSTEHFNFQQHAGGLVGDNHGNSYIYFCYATGTV
ncbi:hypothetical protein LJC29_07810, partial [Bacteroides sp. OttesenSCG-928-N06]|nr:hypothetical protein [Bacteroides sp. OttesenSCG-928-N06]